MGDRVLMQCYSSETNEFGPVVYCHWTGHDAKEVVQLLRKRMQSRQKDLAYSSARLAQIAMAGDDGNLSYGIWNADHKLTAADSHGDAGVVLIDVDNDHKATYLGGYLKD